MKTFLLEKAITPVEEDTKSSSNKNSGVTEKDFGSIGEGPIVVQAIPPTRGKKPCSVSQAVSEAVSVGDSSLCRTLLRSNSVPINLSQTTGSRGETVLHVASSSGRLDLCELLLDYAQCDINALDSSQQSPLHCAVLSGHLEIVKLLIRSGAVLNIQDGAGNTPLHISQNSEITDWLLRKGADPSLLNKKGFRHDQDLLFVKTLRHTRNSVLFLSQQADQFYVSKVLPTIDTERVMRRSKEINFTVPLLFSRQVNGRAVLVFPYYPDGDLATLLAIRKTLPEPQVKVYACQMVRAIRDIHRFGLLIGGFSPSDVLINPKGQAVFSDFAQGVLDKSINKLPYLPPEVVKGENPAQACDWYSLGVVVYEMIIGNPPFFSVNEKTLESCILNKWPKFPPEVPMNLKVVLKGLMNKNPEQRMKFVKDFGADSFEQDYNINGVF